MNTKFACRDLKSVSAFTLIELLVVVAIISVLIAMLLPALGSARSLAQSVACKSNLSQIGKAAYMYANDYNGYLPAAYTPYPLRSIRWTYQYALLLGVKAGDERGLALGYNGYPENKLICPSAGSKDGLNIYTYGANYATTIVNMPYMPFDSSNTYYTRLSKLDNVSDGIFLIGDAIGAWIWNPIYGGFTLTQDLSGDGILDSWGSSIYNTFAPLRHNESSNFLFKDGSVNQKSFKEWQAAMNATMKGVSSFLYPK